MRVSRKRFDFLVARAMRRIPGEFRRYLDNVVVTVHDRPRKCDGESDLLGLYVGIPLPDRHFDDTFQCPDQVLIFQRPIEEICRTEAEIIHEVRVTVVHEVAHHFGFTDDEIEQIMGE